MYESFYKFRSSPFQLAPDSRFFYDSDTHRQGLIRLRHAFQTGSIITAVLGDTGTGKTQLMQKFIDEFDSKKTVVARIPLTSLRANNILDSIATAFGVVNMGFVGDALWSKTALIGKIQQHITPQATEGKKFVVVIDNAESLSKSCLKKIRQLCSVTMKGAPLIQCFLFGETTLSRKLTANQDTSIRLDSLDQRETRRYIEHRLMEAGWQGDPEITESAYSMMHGISEGIPWHINLLCHRVLLQGFLEDSYIIDEHIVSEFLDEQQRQQLDVAGSDVAIKSNIVNLNTSSAGSRTKGTSFIYGSQPGDSGQSHQEPRSKMDSISYFFEDRYESSVEDSDHKMEAVVEEEPDNYVANLLDAIQSEKLFEEEDIPSGHAEMSIPELNDRVQLRKTGEMESLHTESRSVREMDEVPQKSSKNILEKIFPETTAMLHEHSRATQTARHRVYPALDVSGFGQTIDETQDKVAEEQKINDTVTSPSSTKSSTQIAARASIVTSLAITLVMWVISDSHNQESSLVRQSGPADQAAAKLVPQSADSVPNTMTPSPFENPDESPRSRAILNR